MKTIRVQLQGGLGNQLFIWAMAHELQKVYSKKVILIYIADELQRLDRPNELTELQKNCNHGIEIVNSSLFGLLFRSIDKFSTIKYLKNLNIERRFGIYSCTKSGEIPTANIQKVRLLRGYFQNLSIVENNRKEIFDEIKQTFLNELQSELPIFFEQAAHIRRGDTLAISEYWGILKLDYYKRNINPEQTLIICTDDSSSINSLQEAFPRALFSTPETDSAWKTLNILSSSKTLIGANSTLSWWAAWILSNHEEHRAILPTPWRPRGNDQQKELMMNHVTYSQAQFEGE